MKASPRLLLVGWDGADWKLIHPLVHRGGMPAVARLLKEGVCGHLTALEPPLSPMLWTSVATGKHAYYHGVPGFTEVGKEGEVIPVSAATRQCKALWEMLGERGGRTHLVNWFATHGERPNGHLVSDCYNTWTCRREDAPADWPSPPRGTYWPEDLGTFLDPARVAPWEVNPDEIIRLFVPDADTVDQEKDRRLWWLAQRLGEAFTTHSAVCWLLENRPDWNLTAVCYRALDEICHLFMPYHPPRMAGVKEDDFALYRHVVTAAYRLHDLFLARLINLAGPEAAVVLVSAHGFHSDHLRPRLTPGLPAGGTVWHRSQGIFGAMGPGFRKDAQLFGARLLDVTPTLLTWLGLPVGADMEGRVLVDAFAAAPKLETIPSWELSGHPRRATTPMEARERETALQQMAARGSIPPAVAGSTQAVVETERENDWNLARASMDGGRWEEALPRLEHVWRLYPERADHAQMLAICQLRLGLFREARETMEACCETVGGPTPEVHAMLANIALERGDARAAQAHLRTAEAAGAGRLPTLRELDLLGRTQLALREWKNCEATCRKGLEIDPSNAIAFLGLARCALQQRQPVEAAEHALQAIAVQYGNPMGHFLLGVALIGQEKWEPATRALAATIRLDPCNAAAHRLLASSLERLGKKEAAQGALEKARRLRAGHEAESSRKQIRLREESAGRAAELRQAIATRRAKADAPRKATAAE
ncbi:MAG TPA: alkaline phosphatase family protein [Chthoniobacteraceae bacterium]|nr:alkaline phosphatase family protein [Chthoniobacteraceae bacterium]